MISKKGFSPLITTILLIAFAVSVATLFYGLFPKGCDFLTSEIAQNEQGQKDMCYSINGEGFVQVGIANTAEYNITKVRIILNTKYGEKRTQTYEDKVNILPGETMRLVFDAFDKALSGFEETKDGIINMHIISTFDFDGKTIDCTANSVITEAEVFECVSNDPKKR